MKKFIFISQFFTLFTINTYSSNQGNLTNLEYRIVAKVRENRLISTLEESIFKEILKKATSFTFLTKDKKNTEEVSSKSLKEQLRQAKHIASSRPPFDEKYEDRKAFITYARYFLPCLKPCMTID